MHRRAVRSAWGAAIAVIALTVFAVGAAVFAIGQWNEAREQARLVEEQAAIAAEQADKALQAAEDTARELEARLEAEERAAELSTIIEERAGSVATPMGEVSFFRLSGRLDDVPTGPILATPEGLVMSVEGGGAGPIELLKSIDGRTWVPRLSTLPSGAYFLREEGDLYWLDGENATTTWFSDDLDTWTEWRITPPSSPQISQLEWDWDSPRFVAVGDRYVVQLDSYASVPWEDLIGVAEGEFEFVYPQWNPYEEVLEIHGYGPQGDQRLAVIALDVISHNELGLTDVNTGEELPSLVFGDDSITASELRDHVIGSGIMIETSVGLATAGGDVEFMAVPWSRPSRLKLAPLGDSVYALLEYREGDTVRYDAWATSDGRTWSLLVAGLFADRDATTVDVVPGHDVLFAILREASDGFGAEPVSLWIIHDGVAWDRVEAPALSEISISAFNSGYAMVDFSGLWLSDDGVEWHAIDSDEIGFDIGPPSEDGDWSSDVAGDTIFVTSRSFAQDRVTRWVFTLESDP